jgi:hypothetical protein
MYKEIILSLLSLLLIQSTSTAQQYRGQKNQVNVSLKREQCDSKASSQALELDVDIINGFFNFRLPLVSLQSKTAASKTADCWLAQEYPMISFRGLLSGVDNLTSKKDGSYPLLLNGAFSVLGQDIPISETILVEIEKGKMNMAFNTSISGNNWNMEIELSALLEEVVMNE